MKFTSLHVSFKYSNSMLTLDSTYMHINHAIFTPPKIKMTCPLKLSDHPGRFYQNFIFSSKVLVYKLIYVNSVSLEIFLFISIILQMY